jgi:prepilin-type N-terminal cleavage/methylation domain-containing protein
MTFQKIKLFFKGQTGFTLIELLAALAITALISLGATMANAQVLNQTVKNSDYATASREATNAVYWVCRDAQMAQTVSGDTGFPATTNLVLGWTEWDSTVHQVVYSLNDGKLNRSYSINGSQPENILVAQYINPESDLTYCSSDNGVLRVSMTSSVGEGYKLINVTKMRDVTYRTKLK